MTFFAERPAVAQRSCESTQSLVVTQLLEQQRAIESNKATAVADTRVVSAAFNQQLELSAPSFI
jgi:hypothetical protein